MRRWLSIVLVAAIVVTACTPIDPAEHEWCHIYYLDEPMLNLFIDYGEQTDGGILGKYVENGNYYYQFEIIEPFMVYPDAMEVVFARGYIDQHNITVRLPQGSAFGHDISGLAGLGLAPGQPGALYPVEFEFNAENPVGDDRIIAGFYTNGDMYVSQISVYGRGVSPYGYTECGNMAATNTPIDQPTESYTPPTPTDTPIPTITDTPTLTHTPTATPSTWSCEWDFTVSQGPFHAGKGTYVGGSGWSYNDGPNLLAGGTNWSREVGIISNSWSSSAALTYAEMVYDRVQGSGSTGGYGQGIFTEGWAGTAERAASTGQTTGTNILFSWTGSTTRNDIRFFARAGVWNINNSYSGSVIIKSARVDGTGVNPFGYGLGCNNTYTPTPTNTPTYTPTNTNTPAPVSNTPGGPTSTRTPDPTMTRTVTPSPLPPVVSPTPFTPLPTWTMENTLPVPTAPPTRTLIPLATGLGTATMEATYPVPGFGTGVGPDITAAATAVGLGTLEPVDGHSDIYNLLGTAVAELNDLPGDMTGYVPDPDISPMLGYAKWMLSCTSLYEILGENAGTMACHATVGILLVVVMAVVYNGLRIIMLVMKFAVWIFMKIRDLIPLI